MRGVEGSCRRRLGKVVGANAGRVIREQVRVIGIGASWRSGLGSPPQRSCREIAFVSKRPRFSESFVRIFHKLETDMGSFRSRRSPSLRKTQGKPPDSSEREGKPAAALMGGARLGTMNGNLG